MTRGMLTPAREEKIFEATGCRFRQAEIRLMPYLQYLVVNSMKLDPTRVSQKDRQIIAQFRSKGWLSGGASEPVTVSRDFWDIMNECLWVCYAHLEMDE